MTGERRDDLEVEALLTDRYIDSLLAARDRRARPAPTDPLPASDVRGATHRLEAELPRVHPSFRFEERLASELQAHAARLGPGSRPPRTADIGRLETPPGPAAQRPPSFDGRHVPTTVSRPLLIGGALTSAALSIAGAYVAWRRGHPPLDPMVRAVRAAHRTGLARRLPARAPRLLLRGMGVPGGRSR